MKKILSFIVNEDNQLLILRNNPEDPIHGGDFWYTVTGGFDPGETDGYEVAKREIREETDLAVKEILYLNWVLVYNNQGIDCIEYVYISFVDKKDIILNEENIEYKWCDPKEFLDTIKWYYDKDILKEVLMKAINKEVYFTRETIDQ